MTRKIEGFAGFTAYTAALAAALYALPLPAAGGAKPALFAIGAIAAWRYAFGLVHFFRALLYNHVVFPGLRAGAAGLAESLLPPRVYLLLTSFRIQAGTTVDVYRAAIREAVDCGIPAVLVCSLVELGDEFLVKELFRAANPPPRVRLVLVRIAGSGKRDALSAGFRAISRDLPPKNSVAAVIDGDSILSPGLIRKCAPFFAFNPRLGALTTDEDCIVDGSPAQKDWHQLRFAQRHLQMASMSLSGRVMTLTGRMSMFRADIAANPGFIAQVESDSLEHWRLGNFRFLTGDDKSTWHWVLKQGFEMMYVPDVCVLTVEHPPSRNFVRASTRLMFRWSGNMLRTGGRALALGPRRAGLFLWWCVLDQRVTMWTALTGPVFALFLSAKHSWMFLPGYLAWIALTRWVMTVMLLAARPRLGWRYPFLLYYNQVIGALVKMHAFFRLDRQLWTRQATTLGRDLPFLQQRIQAGSSLAVHIVALLAFVTAAGLFTGALRFFPAGF